jgi:rhodanese-related sulfurtransferase
MTERQNMKSTFFILTALLVLSCAEANRENTGGLQNTTQLSASKAVFQDVSADSAYAIIQRNIDNPDFVILDVRTPGEFDSGHIENATLLDFRTDDFQAKLETLDQSKTYLVHCRSGGRSSKALKAMQTLGFQRVYHIKEGMLEWQEKGLPIVQE